MSRFHFGILAVLLFLVFGSTSGYAQAERPSGTAGQPKPTIVLVHGAWDNSTGWNNVVERLQRRGYSVIAPANPLRDLTSDAAYVSSVLTTIDGPVVLVGHSYGGAVITNAAVGHNNIKALVYIAAFMPDEGETVGQLNSMNPGSQVGPTSLLSRPYPLPDGTSGVDLYLTQAAVRTAFAPDVPRHVADQMFATQRAFAQATFAGVTGTPAWKTIPSWFLIAQDDRVISPVTQRFMAERAGAHISEVRSSHVAHVSHPEQTVRIILAAVDAVN